MSNTLKTTVLLAALTGLILWCGQTLAGPTGLVIAFVFAVVMNLGSWWWSDKIVLAMYRGREVGLADAPELYGVVQDLATKARLPMPRIYIIPSQSPNAFATGRSPEHAAVAVTEGILNLLDRRELAGVLGHELAHIANRDTLISAVAATLAGAIMMLASMARWSMIFGGYSRDDRNGGGGIVGLLVMTIVAPLAAMVIQMAISRSREFQADASAARTCRDAAGLARALRKISGYSQKVPLAANAQTAHLFIINPLRAQGIQSLFSTHPPVEKRIERLQQVAVELGQGRFE